jgi:hypothetical protein
LAYANIELHKGQMAWLPPCKRELPREEDWRIRFQVQFGFLVTFFLG